MGVLNQKTPLSDYSSVFSAFTISVTTAETETLTAEILIPVIVSIAIFDSFLNF